MQDGHEVRVSFTVGEPLPGQLKHLSSTFCVYVNLFHIKKKTVKSISKDVLKVQRFLKKDVSVLE